MGFPEDNQADPFRQGRSATNDLLGGFSSRADLLETQSQALQADAMELMQRALTNAPQVTAQQGIAAALLAAIPTLGGALIGRAVGSTKIPQGMYGVKGLDSMDGMSAGGALGAEIGGKASQDFLTRLDRTKETTPILMAQANLKNQQGNQLAQQANQVENARLQGQLNIDMMPLEEAQRMRLQNNATGGSLANMKAMEEYRRTMPLDPVEQAKLDGERRRQELQDAQLTGAKPLNPTSTTMQKLGLGDSIAVKQERLRSLYQTAIQQLGPGFVESFARKGLSALPATIQGEFTGTMAGLAMELNRAVDPTPSDAGAKAQLQKLNSAIENGHFIEALDQEMKSARSLALAELRGYATGPYPNLQAKGLFDEYSQKWGMNETSQSTPAAPLSEDAFIAKFLEAKKKGL